MPSVCLVEMATDSMSVVDEKWMDASVRHVSQDDGLVLSKRQVDSQLFSVCEERQPAVDANREALVHENAKKARIILLTTMC